jgi:hypothetical protein
MVYKRLIVSHILTENGGGVNIRIEKTCNQSVTAERRALLCLAKTRRSSRQSNALRSGPPSLTGYVELQKVVAAWPVLARRGVVSEPLLPEV